MLLADPAVCEMAHRELARRELARRSLEWYFRRTFPHFEPGRWQLDLFARLQRFVHQVENRESPQLMIFAPPRHGKSMIVSRILPAWIMGKHPDWPLILTSYAASLASGHGRWVRNQLNSVSHARVFPWRECRLVEDSKAKDEFRTVAEGQFLARGVGGGTTGQEGRIVIVDDPFADREQADSEVTRENVWEWFSSVAGTRLMPGGGKLVMHTRWHMDDLAGRLLEQGGWEVASYPALAEDGDLIGRAIGEPLHPELFSLKELLLKRSRMIQRDWDSLYQQNPINDEGGYFKAVDLRTYTEAPKVGEVAIAADFAYKTKQHNDYTCAFPFGMTESSDIAFLPQGFMERLPTDQSVERVLDIAKETGAQTLVCAGDSLRSIGPFLEKRMEERKIWLTVHECPERVDKEARSRTLQARTQMHKVLFPAGELWKTLLRSQFVSFPAGKHDDVVDMAANALWLLTECTEYRAPPKPEWKNPDEKRWKAIDARQKRATDSPIKPLFGGRRRT